MLRISHSSVALLALIVLFVLWIRWWASSGFPLEGLICEITNPPKNCESYNVFFYSAWRLAKAADHWGVLITAFATIAIGYFTYTLKRSTDELGLISVTAAKTQERDTKILQRAYISTDFGGISTFIVDSGDEIVAHVDFFNVGRLPARDVTFDQPNFIWTTRIDLSDEEVRPKIFKPMNIVLPPGGKMRVGTAPRSADEMGTDGYYYVYGQITYTDGFDCPRYTRFCHRYPSRPSKLFGIGGIRITRDYGRYHQHGNDST